MNLALESTRPMPLAELASYVRTIPDFPKPGIAFKDICPLLAEPAAFDELIERISHEVKQAGSTKVVGLESRGFIIGIAVAQQLGLPFVPARKAGKLPGETVAVDYALEYGTASLELQHDAVKKGDRVAIVDDLLATGGTARAASQLVEKLGGSVSGCFFAIELGALRGREVLAGTKVGAILDM